MQAGFAWSKCADVTAVEAAGPDWQHGVQFNEELVALSGGLIPPLSDLRLLSVGGGHTNCFLRAVKAGCRSGVESLASPSGTLCAEALSCARPELKEALDQGLRPPFLPAIEQHCVRREAHLL